MLRIERSFDYVKINLASPQRIRCWGERVYQTVKLLVKLPSQKQLIIEH